jgi:hypothetical protein
VSLRDLLVRIDCSAARKLLFCTLQSKAEELTPSRKKSFYASRRWRVTQLPL